MKLLPTGIENFKTMIDKSAYYVDKTNFIEDVLSEQVVLYTRPRRFGKTLNMSMLYYFFSIKEKENAYLFDGLNISKNKDALKVQNKYPTIFISLKEMKSLTFDAQISSFSNVIYELLEKNLEILSSDQLSDTTKDILNKLHNRSSSAEDLKISLRVITNALYTYYQQKVIVLIDEYDVPLQAAYQNNYYEEMVEFLRSVFSSALKTNDALEKGVMTGCLRISKESIFTGLNNFKILSIDDARYDEQFGFTDAEVSDLLEDYDLSGHFAEIKEWYDGYHFGNADIYCPWDVINHVDHLLQEPDVCPQAYWINSSGNDLVKRFVDKADKTTRDEIEQLIAGNAIEKRIRLELTYDEIENSIDNLWSVLFTTGYLTQVGKAVDGVYRLVIPNKEVREVFVFQIQEWFRQTIVEDAKPMQELCQAFLDGDAEKIQKHLTQILGRMISILDTKARDEQKENFYHGVLLGLLRSERDWLIRSNVESGDGFCDILIEPEDPDAGMVIELKYAATFRELDSACEKAMQQIRDRRYDEALRNDGRENILAYGIAFCKKRCKVVCEKL